MDDRQRNENDLYRRYEARIVRLEIDVEDLKAFRQKYTGIVDVLRDSALMADALAAKLELARRGALSKWQLAVACFALFVPSMVTAGITILILTK